MNALAMSGAMPLRRGYGPVFDVRASLVRLAERVRSESAGATVAPPTYSPLAVGLLIRAGVSVQRFYRLVRSGADDAEVLRFCAECGRI
jgi:hypothetical protein